VCGTSRSLPFRFATAAQYLTTLSTPPQALHSLSIGFAGTMTNLAALVFEARAVWQSNRWRWCYVLGSVAAGQALMVAIFGGLWWGGSTVSEVCSLR